MFVLVKQLGSNKLRAHQCTVCGVLYDCNTDYCDKSFQYDRCPLCKHNFNY